MKFIILLSASMLLLANCTNEKNLSATSATTSTQERPAFMCTKIYRPVCGEEQLQCITTPCQTVKKTYSNKCMMKGNKATFLHDGKCK